MLDDADDGPGCFAELFEHFSRPQAWRCDPDVATTLPALAGNGTALALASNYDRRLRSVVAGLPDLAAIQHLVISSEVGWRKPAGEFFTSLCRAVDQLPEHILFVGDDRTNDYEGARVAGLQAVLLDSGEDIEGFISRIERLSDLV